MKLVPETLQSSPMACLIKFHKLVSWIFIFKFKFMQEPLISWLIIIMMMVILLSIFLTATYPLDLTKTRLQIQGEINVSGSTVSYSNRGMVKILHGIGMGLNIVILPSIHKHNIIRSCDTVFFQKLNFTTWKILFWCSKHFINCYVLPWFDITPL